MPLNERKKQILKSVVDAYIESGEPVGSKYLTSLSHMSLSPATVRNEMSELEKMGYLDKPHASAGRVPSTRAYKLYVDKLMEDYRLNLEEMAMLNDIMRFKMAEVDSIVDKAGKIMSEVTKYVSIALTETSKGQVVTRFDAVLIDENGFLLIIIPSDREVKTQHIKSGILLDESAVARIKSVINTYLVNIPVENIPVSTVMQMEAQLGVYWPLASVIARAVYKSLCEKTQSEMKVGGLSNLLSYPEFYDIDKLHKIMKTFDEKQNLYSNLFSESDSQEKSITPIDAGGGMKIYIGDERENGVLSDTSFVFCSLPVENTHAVFGVLGPKRMDYKKVVSSMKQIVNNMEKMLNSQTEKEDGENE